MFHWIKHLLRIEPCMNYTEWRGEELWHYVICVQCGKRVIEFRSSI
jgi:hypothetical protein